METNPPEQTIEQEHPIPLPQPQEPEAPTLKSAEPDEPPAVPGGDGEESGGITIIYLDAKGNEMGRVERVARFAVCTQDLKGNMHTAGTNCGPMIHSALVNFLKTTLVDIPFAAMAMKGQAQAPAIEIARDLPPAARLAQQMRQRAQNKRNGFGRQ